MSILEQVLGILTTRGRYQHLPRLVMVDDVDFEFDAILRGPGDSQALVVISEAGESQLPLALARIRALSHVMLRSGSTRSLTLIVLKKLADAGILRELSSVCRIIQVGGGSEGSVVSDLRPLLPLELPEPEAPQGDAVRLLRTAIGVAQSESLVSALFAAGRKDAPTVEEAVINAVIAAITADDVGENNQ